MFPFNKKYAITANSIRYDETKTIKPILMNIINIFMFPSRGLDFFVQMKKQIVKNDCKITLVTTS